MKKKHYWGIRAKIILCTVLCVVAVGLLSNIFLYHNMQTIIVEKVTKVNKLYTDTIGVQVSNALEKVSNLNFYCANADTVIGILGRRDPNSTAGRAAALRAQDDMNSYLRTSGIDQYVNKLVIFNESGTSVHALSLQTGSMQDYQNITQSEQFNRWKQGGKPLFDRLYPSVQSGGGECLVILADVYGPVASAPVGYVYAEINPRIITDILEPYNNLNQIFLQTESGQRIAVDQHQDFLAALPPAELLPESVTYGGTYYSVYTYPLQQSGLTLVSCVDQSELQASNQSILYTTVVVGVMIVLIAAAVLVILTHYITGPINRITQKINKIALNDYSYDPELEKNHNEMGEIGARLNELGLGFDQLLKETIDLHDQQQEIEMAFLQSQVNPHFLYNTLNSIHWMAVVQKNPGIVNMTRSLVNLLKNLSKGVSAHITLAEELALLDDYIAIQSIRYMDSFEYICNIPQGLREYRIIKFTLQPIVENAIFHGIEPKGSMGTITLDGREDGDYVVLTITDDGIGMTEEEISAMLKSENRVDKAAMCGIGVANVNKRLKLAYGKEAGLSVESIKGRYTKVSVRILKET